MISPWQLLVLSAGTREGLDEAAAGLRTELTRTSLAATAARLRREARHSRFRRFVLCADTGGALAALDRPRRAATMTAEVAPAAAPSVVFLFPGGGAQFPGMAADVYAADPVFRDHVDRCAALFQERLGLDVRSALDETADLDDPRLGLAALFTVECALACFWRSLGVRPAAVLGHSLGEYAAAVLAGVLSLRDAAALVAVRARLLAGLPAGAMIGVELAEEDVRPLIAGTGLSIAAVNAPRRCVVSGPDESIAALDRELNAGGVGTRRVHVATAAHSALVDAVLEEFGRAVVAVRPRPPLVTYVSNMTGRRLSADEATDPRYWQRHLRAPVRFAEGLAGVLHGTGSPVLLEVGPGTSLANLVRQNDTAVRLVSSLRHPLDQRPDAAALTRAVGELWLAGVPIDWTALDHRPAEDARAEDARAKGTAR